MKKSAICVGTSFVLALVTAGCEPPPEDEYIPTPGDDEMEPLDPEDFPDPLLEAPGAEFVDTECGDVHKRFDLSSFTHKGARYARSGGVETFEKINTSCNRVEIDTNTHYKSGRHVFEGDVRPVKVVGSKISVVQIFKGGSGPVIMIRAYNSGGGTLRSPGGATYATGVMNKWTNLRIVHDLPGDELSVYINGTRKYTTNAKKGGTGGFNVKYGNYGTGAPTTIQWRNASWN
jgi:hypothetical protein